MQDGDERITVSEALNRTGTPWGDQQGARCERVQQIFGGEDEEFLELVVSKEQFKENTAVLVPEYTSAVDTMQEQIASHQLARAVVVAVHRVRVGPTWQMRGVMMDANCHLFRFLVPEKASTVTGRRTVISDWVLGAFIHAYHFRVVEMALPQTTPVRPWMIILVYKTTPTDPNLPTSVENITEGHQGFLFHRTTLNQVMQFGELWCQPHNWLLERDEVVGSFFSTEAYLDKHGREMGEDNRPAAAVVAVTSRGWYDYETRFVTRIDTWKNKYSLERVYPVGCTCFSAFHCAECLVDAFHPSHVSLYLLDDSLKGITESYEDWYANNIPGATVGAAFPVCLRAAIIEQTQKDLQKDIKE